jgi:hypothetical protein
VVGKIPEEIRGVLPFLDTEGRVSLLKEALAQRAKGPQAPKTRELKIGNEVVTEEMDPATGEWRVIARGGRFAPPQNINVNTTDPNALPLDIAKFERDLAGDWEKNTQSASDAIRVHQTITTGLQANNGLGDLAAIYGFVKSLDPGSVVREGEIDLMNSAKSIVEQMKGTAERAQRGNLFTPEMRARMQMLSDQLLAISQQSYARGEQSFQRRLESMQTRGLNIDPQSVMSRRVNFPQTGTQQIEEGLRGMGERLSRGPFGRLFGAQ